jgi:exodeoxyribonuclease VII small subunit
MTKKKLSYREAIREVEDILQQIEHEELDVDELAEKVKKAATLLKWCREKLRSTEEEVDSILKDIHQDEE